MQPCSKFPRALGVVVAAATAAVPALADQAPPGTGAPEHVIEVSAGVDEATDVVEVSARAEPVAPLAPPPGRPRGATSAVSTGAGAPPDVTVMGVRADRVAGSTHVIGKRQLERNEYDDPHRVLLQVPGLYVRGEDGFGLRPNLGIRGANSDRSKKVTLMEDGVLLAPAPYSAPAAYYFPLITRMVSVRVVKGPAGIAYGPQTIGGAVDLRTRSVPTATSGQLDVAAGQFGYGKLHGFAGSSTETSGFLIEGAHLRSDGFKSLDGGGGTGFHRNEWMAKATRVVDPAARVTHEFTLKAGFSNETSHETYLGLTDDDFRDDAYRRYRASARDEMSWHRTQVALTHRVRFDDAHSMETTAYRHDLSRVWNRLKGFRSGPTIQDVLASPDVGTRRVYYDVLRGADAGSPGEALMIGPNDRRFVSQGVQTVVRWRPRTGAVVHQVEHGVRVHHDRIDRAQSESGFLMTGGRFVPDGLAPTTTDDNTAATTALALHALDAMTWGVLTLTPGVRLEVIRWTYEDRLGGDGGDAYAVAIPGVGAFLSVTEELGVLGGVYRGFSPTAPGPSPTTADPELSVNYELGARYSKRATRADVVGFLSDYSNLTDVCTFSNGCLDADLDRQFDAGRARIYGVEAGLQHDLTTTFGLVVPLLGTYTFTRGELLENFTSADPQLGLVSAGDELPYIPRHQASFTVGAELAPVAVHASGTYVGSMREQAGSGALAPEASTDAYFTLDVGGRVDVAKGLQAYANVSNLLDDEHLVARRPFGARPGMRRWGHVGLRYTF